MRASQDCKAIRVNDEMCCGRCGLSWAVNEDKPECAEMKIAPVKPVAQAKQRVTAGTVPYLEAYVARVQDLTDHTPNRAINVLVFAPDSGTACRMVDALLGMPTQWRFLRIEIKPEHVIELDEMANLGMKRVAHTHAEVTKALSIMDKHNYGCWRSQHITPGLAARVEIRSWVR